MHGRRRPVLRTDRRRRDHDHDGPAHFHNECADHDDPRHDDDHDGAPHDHPANDDDHCANDDDDHCANDDGQRGPDGNVLRSLILGWRLQRGLHDNQRGERE
jgi:hypothetical protein